MRHLSKTCNCCGTTWITIPESALKPWIDDVSTKPRIIGWVFQCKGINSDNEVCESTLFIKAEKEESLKIKIFSILGLILLLLSGCGKSDQKPSNGTLYIYGDSISLGRDFQGYGPLIASYLKKDLNNKSVSGSAMFAANQYPLIMSETFTEKDIVMYSPGMNDVLTYVVDQNYIAQYTQGLTDILLKLQSFHIKVYIGTTNQVVASLQDRSAKNSNIAIYAQIARDLVKKLNDPNIVLVDFYNGYTPTSVSNIDAVHPNQTGYNMMAQYFMGLGI